MTTRTYHEASRALLAQAESELARDDVRQASEKGLGAAAQMVKAIAEAWTGPGGQPGWWTALFQGARQLDAPERARSMR